MQVIEIPIDVEQSLDRYVENYCPTGGFLRAVLENDLVGAFGKADIQNTNALKAIVTYVYNNIPADSWGSPEKVKKWLSRRT